MDIFVQSYLQTNWKKKLTSSNSRVHHVALSLPEQAAVVHLRHPKPVSPQQVLPADTPIRENCTLDSQCDQLKVVYSRIWEWTLHIHCDQG